MEQNRESSNLTTNIFWQIEKYSFTGKYFLGGGETIAPAPCLPLTPLHPSVCPCWRYYLSIFLTCTNWFSSTFWQHRIFGRTVHLSVSEDGYAGRQSSIQALTGPDVEQPCWSIPINAPTNLPYLDLSTLISLILTEEQISLLVAGADYYV